MKKIKTIMLALFFALAFAPIAWADEAPAVCPSIETLKQAKFIGVDEDKENKLYYAYQVSKYKTSFTWVFVMGLPADQATSKKDAMNKAKEALKTLSGTPLPEAMDSKKKQWYCLYENNYQYLAVAITPINVSAGMPSSISSLKVKK